MKKLSFIILFLPLFLTAQTWQWAKHIGGTGMDNAFISHIDKNNNIYLYGSYAINSSPQFNGQNCYFDNDTLYGQNCSFIAKYDGNGNLTWLYNLVSPLNYAIVNDMEYDSISNAFYLVGDYYNAIALPGCNLTSSGYNYFLAKMNLDGNCIWSKNIGSCVGVSTITFDYNGNLYLGGNACYGFKVIDTCHFNGGNYIAKFNSEGSCIWAKTKSLRSTNLEFNIQKLMFFNNNLFALANVGATNTPLKIDTITVQISCSACLGVGVLCMDTSSNARWLKVDGLPLSDIGPRSMGMNKNGEIYYFAVTLDTCVFGHDTIITSGINSMVIVKYDKSGTLLGINHVNKEADYIGSNSMGIFVLPEGSYYIADGLTGSGYFGNNFITSNTPLDLLIAHYSNAGECLGVDHVGGGLGTSIAVNENAVYISGILSPFPSNTGSMSIANHTFQTYGYEDIVFIKHELITGKRPGIDKVVVYPNPNNGSFSVIVPIELLNEANLVLSLFDNLGKLLLKRSIAFNEWNPRVEIYGQPTGLYFITVSNGRKSYCGKMIVE